MVSEQVYCKHNLEKKIFFSIVMISLPAASGVRVEKK